MRQKGIKEAINKLKKIKAGGGVVYRVRNGRPEILMIYRNGYWDLPKGKLDPGETIEQCAAREVAEETGCRFPSIVCFLCETYHTYTEEGEAAGKTTLWYAMIETAPVALTPQKSEGIARLAWMRPEKAVELAAFENLKDVIKAFRKALDFRVSDLRI